MINLFFIISVFCLWMCAVAQTVGDYGAFYRSIIGMVCVLTSCLLIEIIGDSD